MSDTAELDEDVLLYDVLDAGEWELPSQDRGMEHRREHFDPPAHSERHAGLLQQGSRKCC